MHNKSLSLLLAIHCILLHLWLILLLVLQELRSLCEQQPCWHWSLLCCFLAKLLLLTGDILLLQISMTHLGLLLLLELLLALAHHRCPL